MHNQLQGNKIHDGSDIETQNLGMSIRKTDPRMHGISQVGGLKATVIRVYRSASYMRCLRDNCESTGSVLLT